MVRRDLGRDLAVEVNRAMRESIDWAYANEEQALDYALRFGAASNANWAGSS